MRLIKEGTEKNNGSQNLIDSVLQLNLVQALIFLVVGGFYYLTQEYQMPGDMSIEAQYGLGVIAGVTKVLGWATLCLIFG
jgi:hypothetical protein